MTLPTPSPHGVVHSLGIQEHTMDLFIAPNVDLEKTAAEVSLPEDPNQWPGEVLQELYKQVPYVSDFEPRITMDRVDGERRFGFGHVEISNKTEAPNTASPDSLQAAGVRTARVPIVIKEGKLQPLDIIVTADSKIIPLTEQRLRQAIFRPQAFDITSKTPGDQSMIGQLYPPQRSNFGYGGAGTSVGAEGMGKTGSDETDEMFDRTSLHYAPGTKISPAEYAANKRAIIDSITKRYPKLGETKTSSLLEAILPTINVEDYEKFASRFTDDGLRASYRANELATAPAINKLASYGGWSASKVASRTVNALKPSVLRIEKVAQGYLVKSASHNMWMPKETLIDRGMLVKAAGTKIALDVDTAGSATVAYGANVDRDLPDAERPEQVKDFGIWKVKTTEGEELIGYVFPTLLDLDGQPVPVALFTNGSQAALQADMAGVRVGEGASLFEGPPQGRGIFFKVIGNGKAIGTVPVTVHAQLGGQEGAALMAETFDGQQVRIAVQPGMEIPTKVDEQTTVVPEDWSWMPLDKADSVVLVEHAEEFNTQADARKTACAVTIRSGGSNSFSFTGMPVEKLGYDATQFLSLDDATFLLGAMGVTPKYAQEKLACAMYLQEPIECRIGRVIETVGDNVRYAAEKTAAVLANMPNLRKDLVKEAAFIPDPMAVDTVLSLGFLNPENINIFTSYLPTIDDSQEKLCELLLAARLGLQELSSSALEKAIRSTEEVYEALKVLTFTKS
jgi:hypothetical protein